MTKSKGPRFTDDFIPLSKPRKEARTLDLRDASHRSMEQEEIRTRQERIKAHQREIERIRREAEARLLGKEPLEDRSVIRFSLRLGSRVYHYAAIRADGRWFTSGPSCPPGGYLWVNLVRFIRAHHLVGSIEIMDIAHD